MYSAVWVAIKKAVLHYYCSIYVIFQGDGCGFLTDDDSYVSHPANSVFTVKGSQLDDGLWTGCNGWTGDGSSPDKYGWKVFIQYKTSDDSLSLSDVHIYFSTDVGTHHGLYCPISNHFFDQNNDGEYFSCYWTIT